MCFCVSSVRLVFFLSHFIRSVKIWVFLFLNVCLCWFYLWFDSSASTKSIHWNEMCLDEREHVKKHASHINTCAIIVYQRWIREKNEKLRWTSSDRVLSEAIGRIRNANCIPCNRKAALSIDCACVCVCVCDMSSRFNSVFWSAVIK